MDTTDGTRRVWVLGSDGQRLVEVNPPEDDYPKKVYENCCEGSEEEDECSFSPDAPMLFGDEPWGYCVYCEQPIKKDEVTVPVTLWGSVLENQTEDYPLYGYNQIVHLDCLLADARRNPDEE